MTPEQINIKIAEACGKAPRISMFDGKKIAATVPDYYNDLNACAEMERSISVTDRDEHTHTLTAVMASHLAKRICEAVVPPYLGVAHATAPQRCEAFLRTIGKWEDEQ